MHDVLIRRIGTHIYRLHGGAATSKNIQERRGPSVNIHDTYMSYNIYSTPPRSRSIAGADAKAGPKLLKGRRRKSLGHDIRKLLGGRDV
jgi:hypothetical protein